MVTWQDKNSAQKDDAAIIRLEALPHLRFDQFERL